MEKNQNNTKPIISKIAMFFSGIFMGTVGLFVTLLSSYSVYTIVFLRGLFGVFFLTVFMVISKSFSKEFFKENFILHWKWLLLLSIINPLVILLYFINILIAGYAIAAFLLYTSGIFLLILLIITKEERVTKLNVVSFFLAFGGVAVIMEFWNGNLISPGIIIGLLSGLSLGLLIYSKKKIYNKRIRIQKSLTSRGNFDLFLSWFTTLLLSLVFLPIGAKDILKLSLAELTLSILLGLIPTALAFTLYNIGIKNDKGGNIVILSYFEPIIATINTIIFIKRLSIFTIIGGLLILIANIIVLKFSK